MRRVRDHHQVDDGRLRARGWLRNVDGGPLSVKETYGAPAGRPEQPRRRCPRRGRLPAHHRMREGRDQRRRGDASRPREFSVRVGVAVGRPDDEEPPHNKGHHASAVMALRQDDHGRHGVLRGEGRGVPREGRVHRTHQKVQGLKGERRGGLVVGVLPLGGRRRRRRGNRWELGHREQPSRHRDT